MILILFFCPQGFSTPHTRLIGHTRQHGQPSLARFCFRRTRTTHIRQEQKQRRKRVSQNHGSAVHRASQRTAFDTRPARHARRHIFHQETCPAAPYTRKYSRDAFAPPAHTHENASKDTYPACLYTERALPSHILPAYSPRPNHSSISCKREKSKTHGYARAIRVQNGT